MIQKAVVAALAAFSTSAAARYATQSGTGEVWKNPHGLCWHGAFWTPDQAIEGCDAVAGARAGTAAELWEVTLSADVLFDFGKSTLKDAGQAKLDELADRLSGAALDEIKIVGHADRIGKPPDAHQRARASAPTRARTAAWCSVCGPTGASRSSSSACAPPPRAPASLRPARPSRRTSRANRSRRCSKRAGNQKEGNKKNFRVIW
ncbi:MAG TPA: OmpA family protein [Burkholderiales bacterium]|nr:OmpA family protein [Burkholderiales bacterium]